MNFASDNVWGACPAVMDALQRCNEGAERSYAGDRWTARAEALVAETFAREVDTFLVTTGTAANALALSALVPAYGAVLCHPDSHIMVDECGAPELFTGGAKLIPVDGADGKIAPDRLGEAIAQLDHAPHSVKPSALSLTQASEVGTLYRPDEIGALSDIAHAHGLKVHMDGARFANAVAALGCAPAETTWQAGVDALSFGLTKNGAMSAEAVVFFDRAAAQDFIYRRKRAGHLWSKGRFLGAQITAMLEDGLWLANARHANAMAARLAEGLQAVPGVRLAMEVEANELFPVIPAALDKRLRAAGAVYHQWRDPGGGEVMIRLVTSFATAPEDVDGLVALARDHAEAGAA